MWINTIWIELQHYTELCISLKFQQFSACICVKGNFIWFFYSILCWIFLLVVIFGCICCICASRRTSSVFHFRFEWRSCICGQLTWTHRQSMSTDLGVIITFSLKFLTNFQFQRDSMDKMYSHHTQKQSIRPTLQYVYLARVKAMTFLVSTSFPIMFPFKSL